MHAERVLRLAVAAERAASTSWQDIGDRLGVSRQVAHERFAAAVAELSDRVLFPDREPERADEPGWWACPDGLDDPQRTVRALDRWAVRHREPGDPEHAARPVSGGLGQPPELAAIEAIGIVSALAKRLRAHDLPAGVSEHRARRTLLERMLEAFDAIADRERGPTARDARAQRDAIWDQLVAWHRADIDTRLTVTKLQDPHTEHYRFALDDQPIAELQLTTPDSPSDSGWQIGLIDAAAYHAAPREPRRWLGDPWPLEITNSDPDTLATPAHEHNRAALHDQRRHVAQPTRSQAIATARTALLTRLSTDLANGITPFAPTGLASPDRA